MTVRLTCTDNASGHDGLRWRMGKRQALQAHRRNLASFLYKPKTGRPNAKKLLPVVIVGARAQNYSIEIPRDTFIVEVA